MEKNNLLEIIDTALEAEEIGIQFYSKLSHRFRADSELNSILTSMAKMKVRHKRIFQNLRNSIENNDINLSPIDFEFSKKITLRRFFEDIDVVGDHTKPMAVLAKAYAFQKESILYYNLIRDIIGKNPELDTIIDFCKEHLTYLTPYIDHNDEGFKPISDYWNEWE